jgi:hypothetical protein
MIEDETGGTNRNKIDLALCKQFSTDICQLYIYRSFLVAKSLSPKMIEDETGGTNKNKIDLALCKQLSTDICQLYIYRSFLVTHGTIAPQYIPSMLCF